MFKKLLAIALAIVFIFTAPITISAKEISFEPVFEEDKVIPQLVEQISWEEKISDELWGVIEKAEDNEKIPVYI